MRTGQCHRVLNTPHSTLTMTARQPMSKIAKFQCRFLLVPFGSFWFLHVTSRNQNKVSALVGEPDISGLAFTDHTDFIPISYRFCPNPESSISLRASVSCKMSVNSPAQQLDSNPDGSRSVSPKRELPGPIRPYRGLSGPKSRIPRFSIENLTFVRLDSCIQPKHYRKDDTLNCLRL